ncbi:hypothetical protein J6V85_04585, partial [Candidatus Saccharibacteria bacterium]|nr:hypothetical protein [Candidatus Saccharibacteria bacterium]
MLKLSRNGIGVLTSQYRSVLKKCAFLNLMAAGFLLFAPHAGMAATSGTNSPDNQLATLNAMGTVIDNDQTYTVLYVIGTTGNNITEIFSDEGHNRGWIQNWNEVYLGQYISEETGTATHVDTEISNKHSNPDMSTSSLTPKRGGGVISNERGSTLIDRVVFNNNSMTEFYNENAKVIAAGGAVMNSADDTGRIDINGSTFTNNYTMQFIEAAGGAIYNNTGSAQDNPNNKPGLMYSSGDTFSYNHAGNEDMSASEYDVVRNAVTTEVTNNITNVWKTRAEQDEDHKRKYPDGESMEARGGAVYNGGKFTMTDDSFDHNYVVGQTTYGGDVFNSLYGF